MKNAIAFDCLIFSFLQTRGHKKEQKFSFIISCCLLEKLFSHMRHFNNNNVNKSWQSRVYKQTHTVSEYVNNGMKNCAMRERFLFDDSILNWNSIARQCVPIYPLCWFRFNVITCKLSNEQSNKVQEWNNTVKYLLFNGVYMHVSCCTFYSACNRCFINRSALLRQLICIS